MKEDGDKSRLWRRGGVEALTLKGFEKKVEMNSRQPVVKAIDGGAGFRRAEAARLC